MVATLGGVAVELGLGEVWQAVMIGAMRHIKALRSGLPDRHGFDGTDGWTIHIEGAAGEMAVSKALDRYWGAPVNTFKAGGDVGEVQVRTRSRHDYELLVRPDDRDADVYVHVTGRVPAFRVHGWLSGQEAKRPEYLRAHGGRPPAYFVPTDALHPIETLPGRMP
jgi:hypothetical protein